MMKLSLIGNRADRVIGMATAAVVATTGAGLVVDTPQASADIVWSGPVNIVIPDNIDGLYMNLVTGETGSSAGAVPGWDINPYTTGPGFNLWGPTVETWFNIDGQYVISAGTPIGDGGSFGRPGSGAAVAGQVALNSANLFGVRFLNEGPDTIHYAWVEITFGASLGDRAITQYAFQSTPNATINAAAIPEPASFSALALGALGLFARRRRAA